MYSHLTHFILSKEFYFIVTKKDYDLLIGDIDEDDEAGLLAYNEWKILVQQRFVIDPRLGVQSYPKLVLVLKEMVDQILPDIVKFASNKPWMNAEIHHKRIQYWQSQCFSRKYPTIANKNETKHLAKQLSDLYTKTQDEYYTNICNNVLAASDEKQYQLAWNLVNRLTNRKAIKRDIIAAEDGEARLNLWFEHFKKLLSPENLSVRCPVKLDKVVFKDKNGNDCEPLEWRSGDFDDADLSFAAERLKNNRSPGIDDVVAEVLKDFWLRETLLELFNLCYKTATVPDEWHQSLLIPIFKKGDPTICNNYRGVALMSICAKLYNLLLLNRLSPNLNRVLRHNQNGFRFGRSTAQQVLALRRIIEETQSVKGKKLVSVFVDFSKAFDSVDWNYIEGILLAYGIPEEIVDAIMSVYYGAQAAVKVNGGISDFFDLGVGVLQGDTLAPFLFVIVLDWVMRNAIPESELGLDLHKDYIGHKCDIRFLTDLCYADDIALITDNIENANSMLTSISLSAKKVGLRINTGKGKTEYILVGTFPEDHELISVDGVRIAQVTDFKYLGSWLMDSAKDFGIRKGLAWSAIMQLDNIWKSKEFSQKMKFLFFQSLIEPILFYNATTWTINETLQDVIGVQYHKLLKYALNIKYDGVNHLKYGKIFVDIGYVPPDVRLRKLRLKFIGHCWRCREYSYQSVSDLIFWKLRVGNQRGKLKYLDVFLKDVQCGEKFRSLGILQKNMNNKNKDKWHKFVNEESRLSASKYKSKQPKKDDTPPRAPRKKHVKPEFLLKLQIAVVEED